MEESKSLSTFQIAGLLIQNSFRFLLNALKSYYKRRLQKSYAIWRHKTIYLPKSTQIKVKNSMLYLHLKTSKFYSFLRFRTRLTSEDIFLRIISAAKYIELERKLMKEEEVLKTHHQQELQGRTKELKKLQDHQEENEKNLKKMKAREENYKIQINEMSGKKNEIVRNKKKNLKEKETELLERIEELKDENSEIKEKIALIESNVTNFISEMGNLLEYSEELEKSNDKRRTSVKKGKSGSKKGRAPLFTLDIGKN